MFRRGCASNRVASVLFALLLLAVSLFPSGFVQPVTSQSSYSWNPFVPCAPLVVTVEQVLGNKTNSLGGADITGSPFNPGITTTVPGGSPKRWLTPGPTPPGWVSPGPPCFITNADGQIISAFVQIDNVFLESTPQTADCTTSYDPVNGAGPHPNNISTCDTFEQLHHPGQPRTCTTGDKSGCMHLMYFEIDNDWIAAGYCGTGTICNPDTIKTLTTATPIDVQGFVYWDPQHTTSSSHAFSGWELHPLTAWKLSSSPPPPPGVFSASFTFYPTTPLVSEQVNFNGIASGGVPPYVFNWNFGDGGTAVGTATSHTYTVQGNYNVTLTVTDSNSTSTATSQIVRVRKAEGTVVLNPTDDTYVRNDRPTNIFGTETRVVVDGSPIKHILLKFNVVSTGPILSAKLRLFQFDSSARGGDIHLAAANWSENNATWNTSPTYDPEPLATIGRVVSNTWYEVDITPAVSKGVLSLRMTSPSDDGAYYYSKEGPVGFAPELVVVIGSNPPPTIVVPGNSTINEGEALVFSVSATDDISQTVSLSAVSLPAGAVFPAASGLGSATSTFTWSPDESQGPGSFPISFQAADDFGASNTSDVILAVYEVNLPPEVIPLQDMSVDPGNTLAFSVSATDPDIPPNTLTFSVEGLVSEMSFDPATGLFSFTPANTQAGQSFVLNFTATDNGTPPLSDSEAVLVTVSGSSGNLPPSLIVPGDQSVSEESLVSFNITATDPDDPPQPVTLSASGLPIGSTFDPLTGTFSWTPDETQGPGNYAVVFNASDGVNIVMKQVKILVAEVNQPPTLTPIPDQIVDEEVMLTVVTDPTDADAPAQPLSLSVSGVPGATISPSGNLSWTPAENQGPANYIVTVTVTDSLGASASQSFTATVNEVNMSPDLNGIPPSPQTVTDGKTLAFTVGAADPDVPANSLLLSAFGLVSGMSFDPASGTFTYTPDASQRGMNFTVTFTVMDNGSPSLSDSETLAIIVVGREIYALVVAKDGNVYRFVNETLTLIGRPTTQHLTQVAWNPDGSFAIITGYAATLIKYDGSQFTAIPTGLPATFNLFTVAWNPDGSYALIGGTSGVLLTYDGTTLTRLSNPVARTIRSISWHPTGLHALMVGSGGSVSVFENGSVRSILSPITSDLYTVAWNPGGLYAVGGGSNGVVVRYDGVAVTQINTTGLVSSTGSIRFVAWKGTGDVALLVGYSGLVLTYDGTTLSKLPALTGNHLYSVAWLGDTATVVGGVGTIVTFSDSGLKRLTATTASSLSGIAWKPS